MTFGQIDRIEQSTKDERKVYVSVNPHKPFLRREITAAT